MQSALDGIRNLSGGRLPKWSPALPRAAQFPSAARRPIRAARGAHRLFSELRRPQHGRAARRRRNRSAAGRRRAAVRQGRLRRRSTRNGSADLCCGQPFESKGLFEAADRKSAELEAALRDASENGRLPDRVRHESVRLPDEALPCRASGGAGQHRVHPRSRAAASRRRGDRRRRSRFIRCAACARWAPSTSSRRSRRAAAVDVVQVDEVLCCGFAGDKGFNRPELNEHALRHLKSALPARVRAGLFVESNLRDRPVGVFGLSLPLDHSSRRRVREPRVTHAAALTIGSSTRWPDTPTDRDRSAAGAGSSLCEDRK